MCDSLSLSLSLLLVISNSVYTYIRVSSCVRVYACVCVCVCVYVHRYRNNRPQQLHTDTPTALVNIDFMMLAAVQVAATGGASRVCAVSDVADRLSTETKDVLSAPIPFLCADEYVTEWGGGAEGAAPLLGKDENGHVILTYSKILRTNVEHALREAEARGLSAPDVQSIQTAMDEVESIANDEKVFWRLKLQAGDVIIMHNRRFLHARDGFEDGESQHRLLLRYWIKKRS